MQRRGLARGGLMLAVLLPVACLALGGISSPDVWWHLAAGEWMLANGEIPRLDPFTWGSRGAEWLDLHWLFQLALLGVERVAGLGGVVIARAALVTTTLGLLLFRFGRGGALPVVAVCVLLLAVSSNHRWLARPDVVSHLLVVVYLVLLVDSRAPSVWWLAPLQLLWVNVQGTFVLGIVMTGGFLAGELLLHVPALARLLAREPDAAKTRRLALLTFTVACASLLNPFGVDGALFPLELWTRISGEQALYAAHIAEFRSPLALGFGSPLIWGWLGLLALSTGGVLAARERIPPGLLLVWLAFGFLSLQAIRNLPLLGIAATAVAALAFPGPVPRRALVGLGLATALAGLLLARFTVSNRYFHWLDDPRRFGLVSSELLSPARATRFLEEQRIGGPIFNDINAGGYVTWRLGPGRAFIDGRLEVHDDLLATYRDAVNDASVFGALVERGGIQSTLLGPDLPLVAELARDPRWTLVYFDASYSVFVRRDAFDPVQIEVWVEAGRELEREFQRQRATAEPLRPAWLRTLTAIGVLDYAPEPDYASGYRAEFFLKIGDLERARGELERLGR